MSALRCIDCADIYNLCAKAIQRKSALSQEICLICTKACNYCADECGQYKASLVRTVQKHVGNMLKPVEKWLLKIVLAIFSFFSFKLIKQTF